MEQNQVQCIELRLKSKKKLKALCNQSAKNFKDFSLQRNFHNVSKQKIKVQRNFCNCGGCALSF